MITVYNVEQVEVRPGAPVTALDRFWVAAQTRPDYDAAQRLVDFTGAAVREDVKCRCVITPDVSGDSIGMVPRDHFLGDHDAYRSVLFHELTHWLALGRRRFGWRGEVSRREPAAEMGAAHLTNHCGIPIRGRLPGDADLVRAWVEGTRDNLWYLELACDLVWMAAHYVVSLSPTAAR